MSTFPSSIISFTDPAGTSLLTSPDHALLHTSENAEITALETKLGVGSGTPTLNKILVGSGNGTSVWGTVWDGATLGTAILGSPVVTGGTITGGTINTSTFGTPTIVGGSIAVDGTSVPLTIGAGLIPTSGTYTDQPDGTITINAQAGNVARIVFGTTAGNRTIGTPDNPTADQALTIGIQTSGSANGTIVWASAFRMSDFGTPSIGTASTWNYYSWRYNGADSKWDYMGQSISII